VFKYLVKKLAEINVEGISEETAPENIVVIVCNNKELDPSLQLKDAFRRHWADPNRLLQLQYRRKDNE